MEHTHNPTTPLPFVFPANRILLLTVTAYTLHEVQYIRTLLSILERVLLEICEYQEHH